MRTLAGSPPFFENFALVERIMWRRAFGLICRVHGVWEEGKKMSSSEESSRVIDQNYTATEFRVQLTVL